MIRLARAFAKGFRRRMARHGGVIVPSMVIGFLAAAVVYTPQIKRDSDAERGANGKILEAYAVLSSTHTGRELLSTVGPLSNIKFEVGPVDDSVIAYHKGDRWGHTIRLGTALVSPEFPAWYVAGVLAHELTHARQGDIRGGSDSRDDEMEAYFNEALVWRELRRTNAAPEFANAVPELKALDGGREAFERHVEVMCPNLEWLGPKRLAKDYWDGYYLRAEERYAKTWKGREHHAG